MTLLFYKKFRTKQQLQTSSVKTPNPQDIPKHQKRIPEDLDTALGGIAPDHGKFQKTKPEFLGQIHDLHVKTEPVEFLKTEKFLGGLPAEAFEPALRVMDAFEGPQLSNKIEYLPHGLSQEILMDLNLRLRKRARADHDVMIFFEML